MEESNSIYTAKRYFEASNNSDFDKIKNLLEVNATYSSQNTGIYLGRNSILKMQKTFHNSFSKLNWRIDSVEEEKPGIIKFEYTFEAITLSSELVKSRGVEFVIVLEGKIRHIEIRNA